ncbi:MAG: glycosyltransferase [Caldilineaceae bacterium]|nr:glycosyltransferase [Caldilineaceae bacterium]
MMNVNGHSSPLTFSIVVNTTDRSHSLSILLRSLEQQSYPHFEVVVVVGPTKDDTLEMLSRYQGRLQVLRCDEANLSKSRNIGLRAAHGDVVAFIDDDAVPCQRWLEQLNQIFTDPAVDATGGVVYLIHPNSPSIQHRLGITSSLMEQYYARKSGLEYLVPPGQGRQWFTRMMGTNMAFRRQAILNVGGFDEFYIWVTDETDLVMRMVNAGHLIHPVKEAAVYHVPASSRNRVVRTNIGRWWVQTQSAIYYTIRNNRDRRENGRAAAMTALHLINGHWLWYTQMWRNGEISLRQMLWKSGEEVWAGADALTRATFHPRRLIPTAEIQTLQNRHEPILPFPREYSRRQGSVDPIQGRQPVITMPEQPLRLCLTSGLYPPERFDGIGRHTNAMAKGLFELGHTVHVITRSEREEVTFYDGAFVHKIPYRLDRYPLYSHLPDLHHSLNYSHALHEKVKQLILNDGIQIVDSPLWQMEALVTAVSDLLPVVVRLQTSVRKVTDIQRDQDEGKRLIGEMERALLERAAYLVPNSQAVIQMVRQLYVDTQDKPYQIIPHGIEPVEEEWVSPFPLERPPAQLSVLYVGRLERRKGIQALFQAIPAVLDKAPNTFFLIAGQDNSQHDGFQRRTGYTYPDFFATRYPRLKDRVKFLGEVSDKEKNELYRTCDLFVAPSLYESFGLIYLEAMNYAKPVIGCRAGGIPEVVDDGVNGLLVEPDAAPPLAEAIVSLLNAPMRLHDMGLAGRQRLLERFTYLQMAKGFEAVYRQAIVHHQASVQVRAN